MATNEDAQLSDAVTQEFAAAGYPGSYTQTILNQQDWLKQATTENTGQTWIKVHRKHLLPDTLIAYRLPWEWDEMDSNHLIIKQWISEDFQEELFAHTQRLTSNRLNGLMPTQLWIEKEKEKDKMYLVLYDHTRRLRAMESDLGDSYKEPKDIEDPYYMPPSHVLKAAKSQVHDQSSQQKGSSQIPESATLTSATGTMLPIFSWSVKEGPDDGDQSEYGSVRASLEQKTNSVETTTPRQRMRALLAHMHRELLFVSELRSAKNYNNLPLKTESDVNLQITTLQDTDQVKKHLLVLISSFVRRVGHILDCFMDRDYDCIVKRKVWAAVIQIEDLHHGNIGAANSYITHSMVKAFIQIVLLLADTSATASQHIENLDHDGEYSNETKNGSGTKRHSGSLNSAQTVSEPPNDLPQEPDARSQNIDPTDPRDEREVMGDTASVDMGDQSTADIKSSKGSESPRDQESDFFRLLNDHIDQIYSHLNQAQQECCMISCSPDEVEDTYNGVDRGKIIALVLDSVLRGNSTCESIPTLDIVEIYLTYTTHLQLQARNNPSKNLLLHLNLLQEELEIIKSTVGKQLDLINSLCRSQTSDEDDEGDDIEINDTRSRMAFEWLHSATPDGEAAVNTSTRKVLKAMQADLEEKVFVFEELTKRVDRLERHIVQRVDIIQEDHGKATLIFTIVATIFLPLSFVTSYLGMNTADIRNMGSSQALLWEVATPFTMVVVAAVLLVAYNASRIVGWLPRGAV
ncbi:hypothetical protein BO71DRAFT_425580 [Aspergillus ellipticus CBS 707.79]|uniref:Cora family metal ion transporter n=1 Tax=Aspergillus ellipticus CBS 707.79 TaxID=1448320 RepID=A0A319DXP4_9EURO|nr:hypothetical protein BO71DRAFT_425580 [Aspergillus ellipticus CBS 707.79]